MASRLSPYSKRKRDKRPQCRQHAQIQRIKPTEQIAPGKYILVNASYNLRGKIIRFCWDTVDHEKARQLRDIVWVARVIEASGKDVKVEWFYWPEQLERATCGGRIVNGRQPYHGRLELIKSNHCDRIGRKTIIEWEEKEVKSPRFYWRQTYNFNDGTLTVPNEIHCGGRSHTKCLSSGHCGHEAPVPYGPPGNANISKDNAGVCAGEIPYQADSHDRMARRKNNLISSCPPVETKGDYQLDVA
ncbi:hypothetical protein S40288_07053 [Stachybotrys chartarum IBT 40288]|nr:hypothetical protein S40288_07053 [Stachybotrys chartarum IBT 40288]